MREVSRYTSREFYLLLLPLFFVLHGYIENYDAMQVSDAISLFGEYALIILILFGNAFLIFRSQRKSAIFSFSLMAFHLFFGALHDALKDIFPGSFLTKYLFILPCSFIAFCLLLIYLKRTKRSLRKLAVYLNLLLLILILVDIPALFHSSKREEPKVAYGSNSIADSLAKPDVYLIIADEYADSASLNQIFGFSNNAFLNALRRRDFHIVQNSKSNYNFTPFAMASVLQMDYVTGIEGRNQSLSDKNRCYELINNSRLWDFFKDQGYEIKNHSIFNLANIPTEAPQNYILIGKDMIVSHTFLSRLNKDLRYHLATSFNIQSEITRMAYFMNRCNQLLLNRLVEEPGFPTEKPKFVYAHLTMPHYPYYFRKNGQPNPLEMLVEGEQVRKQEYIEYLQYSNNILLEAIDRILINSKKPPIIILMGDHGFREFSDGFEKHAPYYYMNLNAVLLPVKNYREFYDGISGVNQFRALLNSNFGQSLPYLKDSSILLYE